MLVAGDPAPDFTATAQDGSQVRLSEMKGSPLILYFFPKAGTYGCTRESMEFAKLHAQLRSRGVRIVGVSVDDLDRQRRFAEECQVPFPLLSDASREIARSYGALGVFGHAKRVTFLIDSSGRIEEVVDSFGPNPHVERARQRWLRSAPPPP